MSIPINKSLEEIRTEMFEHIRSVQDDYAAKGWLPRQMNLNKGIARGLIEVWCWGLYQLYSFLALILKQAFPDSAAGLWLDLHCRQVGLTRHRARKARGTVFFRRTGTAGNVVIPAGRILKTRPDGAGNVYRFFTLNEAVLTDGTSEVAVGVQAENPGAGYNVTAGQISEIVTAVENVDDVENRVDWLDSEGTDDETDKALYRRFQLKWLEGSGVTRYAYQSWGMSVTGVSEIAVLDQHPRGQGTVDVIVRGTAGEPTQQVIDEVKTVIDEEQPMNDDVQIRGVTPVFVNINGTLEILPGYETADVLTQAEQKIRALFDYTAGVSGVSPMRIGEDLTVDRLTATIMQTNGVKKAPWAAPAADQVITTDQLAVLESITLNGIEAGV